MTRFPYRRTLAGRGLLLAVLGFFAAWPAAPQAGAQALNSFDRGAYSGGFHDTGNDSYAVGDTLSGAEYRDFFAFEIPTLAPGQQYTSATFRFYTALVDTPNASETFVLHDFIGSVDALVNGFGGTTAFADLADGAIYGSITLTPAQSNQFVTVALSASALENINASTGGVFVLGGAISTLDASNAYETIGGFYRPNNPADGSTQLLLTTSTAAPEPSALALLTAAAPFAALTLRRRARL